MSNESPVRLRPEIHRAMKKKHGQTIKTHGLSYAVNLALASALGAKAPLTPAQKMSKASKARWRGAKKAKPKRNAAKRPAKRAAKTPAE